MPPARDPAPAPCVLATGLVKRYGDAAVFAGVDLTVSPGEFVAILGESGVGKSTLLNCLAGLDAVDGGRVCVLGQDWAALSEPQAAAWRRIHLGFVFQAFHILPHLTVAQNVGLPLVLLGRPDAERVEQVLAAVGLGGLGERLPQALSGGQLQRVAIARALAHRPRLILADEPTGNLDPRTAAQVLALLQAQTRAHGAALVLVTHSHAAAERADRCLELTCEGMRPL
ncbi:ABC transporter ATP-binding protein [Tepidimonas sp.]|uniref:ABC transporter ATP-binding protein n=1 Tax=Tepidimonas sp. TaxID=2002775 RepID=UPI002FE137E8